MGIKSYFYTPAKGLGPAPAPQGHQQLLCSWVPGSPHIHGLSTQSQNYGMVWVGRVLKEPPAPARLGMGLSMGLADMGTTEAHPWAQSVLPLGSVAAEHGPVSNTWAAALPLETSNGDLCPPSTSCLHTERGFESMEKGLRLPEYIRVPALFPLPLPLQKETAGIVISSPMGSFS